MNNLLGQFEWKGPQVDLEKAHLDNHQKEYEESLAVQLAAVTRQRDIAVSALEGCVDEYGFVSSKYHNRIYEALAAIQQMNEEKNGEV